MIGAVDLRPATAGDVGFLTEMLIEAAFWDPDGPRPALHELLAIPEIARYLAGWPREGDHGVVATLAGEPVGAAWYRRFTAAEPGYGFVDEHTPEITVALAGALRGQGHGRRLLEALVSIARSDDLEALSLSASPLNPAVRLYEALGFERIGVSGGSVTMRLRLAGPCP